MESLPEASEGSIGKGIWFVFHVGDDIISVCHLFRNKGLARIYVNDDVIFEQKGSWPSVLPAHTFTLAGHEFRVGIKGLSIYRGLFGCDLVRDGKTVQSFIAESPGSLRSALPMLLGFIAYLCIGYALLYFVVPKWVLGVWFFCMLGFPVPLLILERRDFKIVEEPIQK